MLAAKARLTHDEQPLIGRGRVHHGGGIALAAATDRRGRTDGRSEWRSSSAAVQRWARIVAGVSVFRKRPSSSRSQYEPNQKNRAPKRSACPTERRWSARRAEVVRKITARTFACPKT